MNERTINKWAAFNSVINDDEVIAQIREEKKHISKPILSDEQILEIEQKIIDAYNSKQTIKLNYFESGKVISLEGCITKIDIISKMIWLNYSKKIYR